jgi:cellulose synthase/poly-beta-1,6-N-acetylglucosamine synthase-like glycosyltransferase
MSKSLNSYIPISLNPYISIIIPVKEINDYLRKETIPAILGQSFQNFEIIILPDKPTKEKFPKTKIVPSWPKLGPADKRDLGAKKARGEILSFLDDDSYPDKDWLENAVKIFTTKSLSPFYIAAVCGPALTPHHDNIRQKASGYVWSTFFGSGGAGSYRCDVKPRREVDDFPTVNFLVRKTDFWQVGGFSSKFWPGEDTKLCHDLVYKLGKKIIYDPRVLVYHHRREVFGPHLRQISRYALHRGHFARILPKTSLRIGYLAPTLFVLGLASGLILILVLKIFRLWSLVKISGFVYFLVIFLYLVGLIFTSWEVYRQEKNWKLALLVIPAIFITHVVYGVLFIKGFLTPQLKSKYGR